MGSRENMTLEDGAVRVSILGAELPRIVRNLEEMKSKKAFRAWMEPLLRPRVYPVDVTRKPAPPRGYTMHGFACARSITGRALVLSLVSLAAASVTAPAQVGWFVQPNPATTHLYSIDFRTSQEGWVSGEEGVILHSTDGGSTWEPQNSGTGYGMRGISFGSALVGVAVGSGGTILRTTDGGATWITVRTDYVDSFFNVEMITDHFGCAVGANGIFRAWCAVTNDGGAGWFYRDFLINNTEASLTDVHFFDTLHGLVSAYVQGGTGAIYRTTDGGSSWLQVITVPFGLYSLSFPTPEIGYASGVGGGFLDTTDGGSTWSSGSTGDGVTEYGVSFPGSASGWVAGASGHIRHTEDGGATWSTQVSGTNLQLNAIQMLDRENGFIAGNNGLLLRTITGGEAGSGLPAGDRLASSSLRLLPNRPNPFRSSTQVRFRLSSPGPVRLEIFDVLGREIRVVQIDEVSSGSCSWTWDGSDGRGAAVAPGVYPCRIRDPFGHTAERVLLRIGG